MARDLTLLTQANGTYTNAQCCVAMVTFCALQDAIQALELKGGANFRNMIDALNKLKVPCDQSPRLSGRPPLPVARAIVQIRSKEIVAFSHFVVWSAGAWYDPFLGFSEGAYHEKWPRHFFPERFIEIKNAK